MEILDDPASCLYRIDGDVAIPTPLTLGPWGSSAQHGGPPSALLTYMAEELIENGEHLTRIHIDLLVGVPLEPLRMRSERRRSSRRIAHADCELWRGERLVARARALLVVGDDVPPPSVDRLTADLAPPESLAPVESPVWKAPPGSTPFHSHGVEHRFVAGAFDRPGPATDWVRLGVDVVMGRASTGAQRVAATADLGSGISALYGAESRIGMINTDLNIAFVGPVVGEWFCLVSRTEVGGVGSGVTVSEIYDRSNRLVALASQSLIANR